MQLHGKVLCLKAISLHHVSQVVLKRINGASTQKSALSVSNKPAPCVQVVFKRISGANANKSALSGSHVPAHSVCLWHINVLVK